ncbi:MAG: MobF family relaxase, partial [Acidimicrobiales bacterium]
MLSIGRLGVASGAEYYLDTVANSVDDYYLGRGEAPGQWIGTTSTALGLCGEVDPKALRNLLNGWSADGEELGIMRRSGRRPGYDLTFSSPKGISLLWAFGSPDVRDGVSAAHDRAVAGVIDHLSREAAYVRRGVNGKHLERATGFVAAGFRHRTSRAGDPQLHTHVLVPNVVCGIDGRWSAPDARQLYLWQKAATAMYHSALRADLASFGLSWKVGRNSLGELSAIPKDILRAFSKRRVDIESSLDTLGFQSQRAAEVAALATRGPKPRHIGHTDLLRQGWESELESVTITEQDGTARAAMPADISGVAMSGQGQSVSGLTQSDLEMSDVAVEEILAVLAGERSVDLADYDLVDPTGCRLAPLTLFASTFTRRDALAAMARALDAPAHEVADLTERLLKRDGVLEMVDVDGRQPDLSGRGRDRPASTVGDRRYTTEEMLTVEGRIVNSAVRRVGHWAAQVDRSRIDHVLAVNRHLDGEQATGVRHLLSSGNGLDLVIGQAGTGKSTMLGAARAGWELAHYQVIGTAIASRTAADLEAGTGIDAVTMAQLLIDLERKEVRLTPRHVVIVDEASLVGSRTLDRLQRHVDQARAKLVLVGDNRQLSSINAGGALRALSNTLGDQVVTLTTNRRQVEVHQEWERQALVELRNGEVAQAIAAYDAHGRIAVTDQVADARQALVDQWWTARQEASTAILAVTRADVAAINTMARARLRDEGELGPEIRLASGKAFAIGDRVLFEKNARAQVADACKGGRPSTTAIRNGTCATVIAVPGEITNGNLSTREGDEVAGEGDKRFSHDQTDTEHPQLPPARAGTERPSLVVELDSGKQVILTTEYLEKSTNLGYALTVFR